MILTITLHCLSKRNTERVLVDREKLAEGVSQEDIQYLKPMSTWKGSLKMKKRIGSRYRTVSGP